MKMTHIKKHIKNRLYAGYLNWVWFCMVAMDGEEGQRRFYESKRRSEI